MLEEVGPGACAIGFRLAVNRPIDIDGVRAAGNGRNPFVLTEILVFAADQQFVLPAADVKQTTQFELGDAVVPVGIALAVAAIDGVAVGVQGTIFGGEAPEFAFFVMAGEAQFPAVVELMFEGGLQQIVVVVDVAVVGFTKEGRTGDTCLLYTSPSPRD